MSELWTPGSGEPREPSSTPDGRARRPGARRVGTDAPKSSRPCANCTSGSRPHPSPTSSSTMRSASGSWRWCTSASSRRPTSRAGVPAPDLAAAGLAIDALAALVDGLTDRLGDGEPMLRDALLQAQMLYVEIADDPVVGDLRPPPSVRDARGSPRIPRRRRPRSCGSRRRSPWSGTGRSRRRRLRSRRGRVRRRNS